MEKKYRLEVQVLTRRSDEQIEQQRKDRDKYTSYSSVQPHDRYAEDHLYDFGRLVTVELTEEEMHRIRQAVIKEI